MKGAPSPPSTKVGIASTVTTTAHAANGDSRDGQRRDATPDRKPVVTDDGRITHSSPRTVHNYTLSLMTHVYIQYISNQ